MIAGPKISSCMIFDSAGGETTNRSGRLRSPSTGELSSTGVATISAPRSRASATSASTRAR